MGKKILTFGLVLVFLGTPLLAYAGVFSFLGKIFTVSKNDENYTVSATTMPLLSSQYTASSDVGIGGGDITIIGGSALLSVVGPLGSLADIEEQKNRSTAISVYVVRDGDTLSEIAKMFDVSVNTIIWSNDITRASSIRPGQTLIILPISGVSYTVKKGDTLASIAKEMKGDADEIIAYNNLLPGDGLSAGQIIIIPNGEFDIPEVAYTGEVVRGSGPEYSGYYIRPINGGRKSQGLHGYNGVDLAVSCGAPVVASASGYVLIARGYGWNGGYGKYVAITHNNGTQTLYAHLSSVIVGQGWNVIEGQVIGYVGSTGLSTGCHVHFEVRGAKNPF
ncbi:MAG: M23 family metallopeptidase [Candidatus Niyogibacteria bacterium]|nr:M23 family metallopeptidase [Candidatus Niyogibacteria bacterium]